MCMNQTQIFANEEGHTTINDETYDIPKDFLIRAFVPLRHRKMMSYWGVDEKGAFYIIRSSINP